METPKEDKNGNTSGVQITFWVFFAVLVAIIIVCVALLIYVAVLFNTYKTAFVGAVFQSSACEPNRCQWINVHPAVPTTFPDSFNKELGLFCAQQVLNLEWLTQNGSLNLPPPLQLTGLITTAEAGAPVFAYVALDSTNRVAYVIERGTETSQEWNLDLMFTQNGFNTQSLFNTTGNINWECPGGSMVHSGFFAVFTQIQQQLESLVTKTLPSIDRLVVSGHSLGAAVSSLSAAYLSSNVTTKPIFVYTFGKPRVGDIEYAQCIADHFPNRFWRVQNEDDIIPALPTSSTPNLNDPNQPWLYQHEGTRVEYSLNWGSLETAHIMTNYITFLQSLP